MLQLEQMSVDAIRQVEQPFLISIIVDPCVGTEIIAKNFPSEPKYPKYCSSEVDNGCMDMVM